MKEEKFCFSRIADSARQSWRAICRMPLTQQWHGRLAAIAIDRMEHEASEQSMNYIYDYFAMVAVEHHVQIFHDSENEKQRERLVEHGSIASKNYKRAKSRRQEYHPRFSIDNAPTQMKEQLLHFYCGGYNTLIDSAISWIEPTDEAKWNAIDALEDAGIDVSEEEFMELFNAWILSTCDNAVILGHTIKDTTRERVTGPIMWDTVSQKIRSFEPVYEK